ncbi:glucose-6-phosphate isomerase [uncultured Paludibaculum sp.]|uniref:glucose-6-phosphate isomerase n=1 Tax=uncultured Paludibaculum sp. TaxID=1765020 RepID=UPI002AABF5BB|nr:glucose-6-phosphate isomerase [uncultured Paludibaculum sp.]
MTQQEHWQRYRKYLSGVPAVDLKLDISRIRFDDAWLAGMEPAIQKAYAAMAALESGAIANPDEDRMVGHYWLRTPALAPQPALRQEIESTLSAIKEFAARVHQLGAHTNVLSIGIGGSALGPMFVADALGHPATDKMRVHFFDNTDPDGIERTLSGLAGRLDKTLVLVISKSGGTPETYNGMVLAESAFRRAGLNFADHAVAITMPGSKLDRHAVDNKWLQRFAMFDWVGGRTSELSAVGLLAAALQGLDIDAMLAGAAAVDAQTRSTVTAQNPAALLALMWHCATGGKGLKDMVVLPYKDRLLLFSRYLQQLVMESLGKRLDLDGNRVDQGLSVYGNKGSTDQHAYVQQLRDGVNNFFMTFLRVLEDGGDPYEFEPGVRAGDYLDGFLLGTREALDGNDRQSITITIPRVDAMRVGALIALFERAVGFYASLVNINAYHQPGVESGKKAAAAVLDLQKKILSALTPSPKTVETIAAEAGTDNVESVYLILEHLAANGRAGQTEAGFTKV